MSQPRYQHLEDEADGDELLTLEDVKDDEEAEDEGGDDSDYDQPEPPSALLLDAQLDASLSEADGDSSVSSRHSESRPFDQDVLQPDQLRSEQQTPTGSDSSAAAGGAHIPPVGFASPLSPVPAGSSSSSSLSSHLSVPLAGLKKSVSIGDKLAGRARELAIAQGRRLDALVRGIETAEAEYVEDYILESLDYDAHEDTMAELEIEQSGALHTHYLLLLKVLMMILIGFVTAMLMYAVSAGVQLLFSGKIAATVALIGSGQAAGAYFAFVFMNLAITGVASSLVAILAPHARGGGVPYALSYLNGTNVAEYFSPRIVLVKAASLIFTISGGLTLGMEGPFVFIGGGVALLCSNLIDRVFPFFFIGFGSGSRHRFSRVIRNIREERVFMAGGLAAGLAVAFDAPIAGVLFALEGSTTFLTVPVVLRIFGCAMFASFFNDLGHNNFNAEIINHNLLAPTQTAEPPWAFSIPEVLPFTLLGVMGGLAGAGATWMNIRMTHWRHARVEGESWRHIGRQLLEVAAFSFATSTIWFVLPYVFGCRAQASQCVQSIQGGADRCPQLQCGSGSYSEIGAFVYSSSDDIARLLFDRSLSYAADYHVAPLIVYGLAYWLLVSLIYGAYVPGQQTDASGRRSCLPLSLRRPRSHLWPVVPAVLLCALRRSVRPQHRGGRRVRARGRHRGGVPVPRQLHQPGRVRAAGRGLHAGRLHAARAARRPHADRADGRRHLPAAHHVLRHGGQVHGRLPRAAALSPAHGHREDTHAHGQPQPRHRRAARARRHDQEGQHRLVRRQQTARQHATMTRSGGSS